MSILVVWFAEFVSDWERSEHYDNSHLRRRRASVIASIEALSPKSMEINFSVNTSKSYRFDA